jgi:hypothetical protein
MMSGFGWTLLRLASFVGLAFFGWQLATAVRSWPRVQQMVGEDAAAYGLRLGIIAGGCAFLGASLTRIFAPTDAYSPMLTFHGVENPPGPGQLGAMGGCAAATGTPTQSGSPAGKKNDYVYAGEVDDPRFLDDGVEYAGEADDPDFVGGEKSDDRELTDEDENTEKPGESEFTTEDIEVDAPEAEDAVHAELVRAQNAYNNAKRTGDEIAARVRAAKQSVEEIRSAWIEAARNRIGRPEPPAHVLIKAASDWTAADKSAYPDFYRERVLFEKLETAQRLLDEELEALIRYLAREQELHEQLNDAIEAVADKRRAAAGATS